MTAFYLDHHLVFFIKSTIVYLGRFGKLVQSSPRTQSIEIVKQLIKI